MASDNRFPIGNRLDLNALAQNPHPVLSAFREAEPVSWAPALGMWLVTRRDDVVGILNDAKTFTTDGAQSTIKDIFGAQMLSSEGALHRRYKSPCLATFSQHHVDTHFREFVEDQVDALIHRFKPAGQADLRHQFAAPLALRTVAVILGFPLTLTPQLRQWYEAFEPALANFAGDPLVRSNGQKAAQAFRRALRTLSQDFGVNAEPSLLQTLYCDPEHGMCDEEIAANAMIIMFGGIETTESMILNALWALTTHPTQLAEVKANLEKLPNAIEEAMRWEPAVQSCTRYVTQAVTLREVELQVGDTVQCMIGAANRDPACFDDPDAFNIHRHNAADHLGFAMGPHFCLGAALARLEMRIGIARLLEELPGLQLVNERDAHPYGFEFRKPKTLWVRWRT